MSCYTETENKYCFLPRQWDLWIITFCSRMAFHISLWVTFWDMFCEVYIAVCNMGAWICSEILFQAYIVWRLEVLIMVTILAQFAMGTQLLTSATMAMRCLAVTQPHARVTEAGILLLQHVHVCMKSCFTWSVVCLCIPLSDVCWKIWNGLHWYCKHICVHYVKCTLYMAGSPIATTYILVSFIKYL